MGYKFSLIMATFGRKEVVEQLIISLLRQTYKYFVLIVLDQNEDDRVYNIFKKFNKQIQIKYIKSQKKGLSANRNIGLQFADGDIIAFPDDDCEYKPDTLEFINNYFLNNNYSILTINFEDKFSGKYQYSVCKKNITLHNFTKIACSITIFTRSDAIKNIYFDEKLGVGSVFGSREETDFLCYLLLKKSLNGFFDGTYSIYHRILTSNFSKKNPSYGASGLGAFHKKLIIYYKYYRLLPGFFLLLIKNIIALLLMPQKKYFYETLKGKIQGFFNYKNIG